MDCGAGSKPGAIGKATQPKRIMRAGRTGSLLCSSSSFYGDEVAGLDDRDRERIAKVLEVDAAARHTGGPPTRRIRPFVTNPRSVNRVGYFALRPGNSGHGS